MALHADASTTGFDADDAHAACRSLVVLPSSGAAGRAPVMIESSPTPNVAAPGATEELGRRVAELERELAEARRARDELAQRNPVTGLPRFESFASQLAAAIAEAALAGTRVMVLYLDIDNLHLVNETRGHAAGDHVLRTVAERLAPLVAGRGFLAHAASDEFVLALRDDSDAHDQLEVGERVRRSFEEPIALHGENLFVTGSIGVSCFPDHGATSQELLREAEAAMQRAKRSGRNAVSAFTNEQRQQMEERLLLGLQLRDAIRQQQFVVQYQPQIRGQDWLIYGFEALVRWHSPQFGLLPPGRFLPIAEELGLSVDIGNFVLESVCRQARAWRDAGMDDFLISINVSPVQLRRPQFVDTVRAALARHQVPAHCLELELTEQAMAGDVASAAEILHALKALGVRLAIDDFGAGYSSLRHLRRLPVDRLKIDGGFVRDISSDAGAAGVCRAIITLGHQLGMQVLAEGVETAAEVGYLLRNECDAFQGFYFSAPVSAEQALELLRHRYLAQDPLPRPAAARTLLLLDDEENVLRALTRALRRDGYRILTATTAQDAFEHLARNEVQVIISDQRMPELSGTEFLSQVKAMYPDTVRMVLSGYSDVTVVTDAINRGAIYKFLTKPWNDDDLRLQIQDAFRIARRGARAQEVPSS
jgi:diguanylate cyclase (GGDEF)-like protein